MEQAAHFSLFGLTGFILVCLVCIPLGIIKALKHGSKFDTFSSFIVFLGYSTTYALAAFIINVCYY